jgi:agmatinase
MHRNLAEVNERCGFLLDWVTASCRFRLQQSKIVGILGGDHSTPLGLMTALGEMYPAYGILQIDAHMDLRDAYEGFEFSHASIMFNALKLPQVKQLTQVGIRDYCLAEAELAANDPRIQVFFDRQLSRAAFSGKSWEKQCQEIVKTLPHEVYVSFDIDGLDPKLCPHTGTPVPGGLGFEQAMYLLEQVVASGKRIIGFDLCEVAPGKKDDWDANVGARVLYRLANLTYLSQQKNSKNKPKKA